jgi:hypothetical protein
MKPVFFLRPSAPAWQVIGEVFSLFASDERLDYAAYGRFIDFKKTVMCATALHACLTRTHAPTRARGRTDAWSCRQVKKGRSCAATADTGDMDCARCARAPACGACVGFCVRMCVHHVRVCARAVYVHEFVCVCARARLCVCVRLCVYVCMRACAGRAVYARGGHSVGCPSVPHTERPRGIGSESPANGSSRTHCIVLCVRRRSPLRRLEPSAL